MSNNLPSPFEVWRLAFYFDDKPEVFRYRPVVILDINSDTGEVLVAGAKVTSPHRARTVPERLLRNIGKRLDCSSHRLFVALN